ncbi:hypothetical protein CEXT_11081 [Caerostris extrusa]|uniref:Uncharacterized protein n=1 Tax=Caerostris extrusa TaxID=172846 RepID=A0AAV4QBY4_CAEEX|nr:hypothetical protein CEXT_11081 [Caerostris extrusa]
MTRKSPTKKRREVTTAMIITTTIMKNLLLPRTDMKISYQDMTQKSANRDQQENHLPLFMRDSHNDNEHHQEQLESFVYFLVIF